jgi:RimJ/RimL family protein N-acetyltransferase
MNKENEEPIRSVLSIDIRYTEPGDAKALKKWLMNPDVKKWFPMADELEVDDAVNRWIAFYRYRASLTAVYKGEPAGLCTLYLQPYRKLAHQCEFGIIVAPEHRGNKVGSELLNNLMHLAKDKFRIELLHLQVYQDNPAIRLYKRFGFQEFGRQTHWIKEENNEYTGRVFMERFL